MSILNLSPLDTAARISLATNISSPAREAAARISLAVALATLTGDARIATQTANAASRFEVRRGIRVPQRTSEVGSGAGAAASASAVGSASNARAAEGATRRALSAALTAAAPTYNVSAHGRVGAVAAAKAFAKATAFVSGGGGGAKKAKSLPAVITPQEAAAAATAAAETAAAGLASEAHVAVGTGFAASLGGLVRVLRGAGANGVIVSRRASWLPPLAPPPSLVAAYTSLPFAAANVLLPTPYGIYVSTVLKLSAAALRVLAPRTIPVSITNAFASLDISARTVLRNKALFCFLKNSDALAQSELIARRELRAELGIAEASVLDLLSGDNIGGGDESMGRGGGSAGSSVGAGAGAGAGAGGAGAMPTPPSRSHIITAALAASYTYEIRLSIPSIPAWEFAARCANVEGGSKAAASEAIAAVKRLESGRPSVLSSSSLSSIGGIDVARAAAAATATAELRVARASLLSTQAAAGSLRRAHVDKYAAAAAVSAGGGGFGDIRGLEAAREAARARAADSAALGRLAAIAPPSGRAAAINAAREAAADAAVADERLTVARAACGETPSGRSRALANAAAGADATVAAAQRRVVDAEAKLMRIVNGGPLPVSKMTMTSDSSSSIVLGPAVRDPRGAVKVIIREGNVARHAPVRSTFPGYSPLQRLSAYNTPTGPRIIVAESRTAVRLTFTPAARIAQGNATAGVFKSAGGMAIPASQDILDSMSLLDAMPGDVTVQYPYIVHAVTEEVRIGGAMKVIACG